MKTVQIPDELYDELKKFVVDPFDDTPETVIGRVVNIANKAKARWSPLDAYGDAKKQKRSDLQAEDSLVTL